jgi:hypothetical protein
MLNLFQHLLVDVTLKQVQGDQTACLTLNETKIQVSFGWAAPHFRPVCRYQKEDLQYQE